MTKLTDSSYFTWKPGGDADTTEFGIRLPNKYDVIAADLGLIKATSEAEANGVKMTTNKACRQGLLIKLKINYRISTSGRRGSTTIVCNPKKVSDAMKSLNGKEYGTGNPITSVNGRLRQDFR